VTVATARDGGVLTITLDRADRLNALTSELLGELLEALHAAEAPDVRAVVLTGAGRAFCVGQDLSELEGMRGSDVGELLRDAYHPVVVAIRGLRKPVLAAVNGPAAGAGLALACACDIRLASDAAVLVPAFAGIGLVPDSGLTWSLARLLGPARALRWMLEGDRMEAAAALALGVVDEVVPAASLARRAADRAAELAAGPTHAFGLTKRLFEHAPSSSLEDQLEREEVAQARAFATDDHREGAAAFREKRPPRFTGH
jgi:2-(1,2-epoxy-1,2-dihydrophenyl)acetyl-CoA isomerase